MSRTDRLETIAKRQRRMRDLLFACFLALAAVLGASAIGVAVRAVQQVAHR